MVDLYLLVTLRQTFIGQQIASQELMPLKVGTNCVVIGQFWICGDFKNIGTKLTDPSLKIYQLPLHYPPSPKFNSVSRYNHGYQIHLFPRPPTFPINFPTKFIPNLRFTGPSLLYLLDKPTKVSFLQFIEHYPKYLISAFCNKLISESMEFPLQPTPSCSPLHPSSKNTTRQPSTTSNPQPYASRCLNNLHPACTDTPSKKYKTQLCKNYSEKGHCPYRDKCRFAHGQEQLHPNYGEINKKFRTKKCKSYWSEGFCSYGSRCQFYHQTALPSQTTRYLSIWKFALQTKLRSDHSRVIQQLSSPLEN